MGWLIGWGSRKQLIEHLSVTHETEQSTTTCIAKYFSGNNFWSVWERQSKLAPTDTERYLILFMLKRTSDGWGYKDVDESMGPYQHSCPLSFLDMVPDPGGYATEFRARCRAAHAIKHQKLAIGQTIKLTNGRDYRVIELKPLRAVDVIVGTSYRIPRRMLTASN